jgi:transposase
LGGSRGRLITTADRLYAIQLIEEACNAGARKRKACELLDVSMRTVERWGKENGLSDKRHETSHVPTNKLTLEEREMILMTANSKFYRDLPPCKIVPMLADNGCYIASESSFYRVLREGNQLAQQGSQQTYKASQTTTIYGSWCKPSMELGYFIFANASARPVFLLICHHGYFQSKNYWVECSRIGAILSCRMSY